MDKRTFLKLMGGLSLGLLPLIGCYEPKRPKEDEDLSAHEDGDKTENDQKPEKVYKISEQDIVLLEKNNETFQKHAALYNKRIEKSPQYIAVCKTETGIQYAIQLAKKEGLPIAIKSGGHSFEGFSSNNEGMVIYVGSMKNIKRNEDGSITIQSGILLSELHQQVYAKGLMVPSGSCGGVAISGLTLGGGYGFFSRKYGLTSDNLIDATLITADEEIIYAKDHPDVLWALKGGGNGSFGVVADLTFKTHPAPSSFSSHTLKFKNLNASRFEQVLQKWMDTAPQLPEEGFAAFVLNGNTLTILFTSFNGVSIKNKIQSIIQDADTYSESINKEFVPSLKRFYGRKDPLYFKNASCGYYNSYEDLKHIAAAIFNKVNDNRGLIFQINTLGAAINQIAPTATAYPHRNFLYLSELQTYYENKSQEAKLLAAFEDIQNLVYQNGITQQYANYPDLHFKNWQQAYFGENYSKLQTVKQRLDPQNLFRHEQSIESKTLS